ncbi:hemicentin-2-like isoform X3 [Takifugu rubripes]|uniref:hemicentin-2-like isoform X3 n=1 Tax=Takifugu rubripes TaxID=31033 RepID=UPI001145BBBF|nr:hemicentin-2-like isoform X3 [Takifugu rubripes]
MGLAAAAFLLLLIAPVLQAQYTRSWGVKYTNGHIFAVKGSTVNISCTYIYPWYHKVTDKFWFLKKRIPNFENLMSIPEYSGRVENICDDKINRCTLIIRNLTESDSTVYMFRFITDQDGKYYGKTGVSLRVSDLQVIGSTQNLSCGTCSLTPQQNCNLFKTEQKILGNIYYAAPEDNILTDDCTCRIEEIGHSGVSVEAATSTSTEICVVKGSTVDISCNCKYPSWLPYGDTFWVIKASDVELSSNSHHSYTCFKEYLYYQSKYNYRLTVRITNVHKNDSAVYKFMIRTNTGGWRLTGETGVRLTVPDPVLQVRVSRQESSNRNELTCQSQCGASLYSYIWYKNDEKVDGATRIHDVSLSINSSARYSCTVIGYESFRSPAVYAPEGPLVSVSPSGEVEEDTTITLNCSSDANPAANYSWYKEGENSSKSSEQNFVITQVTAKDSGRYSCRVWKLLGHSESTVNVTVVPVWPWKLAAIGSGVGIFLIGLTGVFVVLFRIYPVSWRRNIPASTSPKPRQICAPTSKHLDTSSQNMWRKKMCSTLKSVFTDSALPRGQLVPWTVLMQSTAQSSRNLSFVFLSSDVVVGEMSHQKHF